MFSKRNKRPFILLEAVISLSILAMTSSVLLSFPVKVFKKNIDGLYEIELALRSELLFFELEKNFQNKVPFEALKKKEPYLLPQEALVISLNEKIETPFSYHFELSVLKQKTAPQSQSKLVKASLIFTKEGKKLFNKKVFERLFFVMHQGDFS